MRLISEERMSAKNQEGATLGFDLKNKNLNHQAAHEY